MSVRIEPAKLLLFATPAHECSYLPGSAATTLFVDPEFPKDPDIYTLLSHNGFRRSGEHVYRPNCPDCSACVPVRVPVEKFTPRRNQRRALRDNRDLRVVARESGFCEEHFLLYSRYLGARHGNGGMDNPTRKQYREFLLSSWADTLQYEFRLAGHLVAVAVTDHLVDGLSAVYTFFDPDFSRRALGTYCVLWQIEETRRLGREWLYLGYWIADSPKMLYKQEFQPQERFIRGRWHLCHR
ncbi:MAG: arginyltransferase [Gammaproteobacteria bacterium]|nr:MAG: arginyltransferase [Gammaproteobacteria bacterium]